MSTVIIIPFCSWMEKLAIKTVKSKEKEHKADRFDTLDERFLSVPVFAVDKCKDLVGNMAMLSLEAFNEAVKMVDKSNS